MNYYKVTDCGMVSQHDKNYIYKFGLNEERNAENSKEVCGIGLHLAKTIVFAKSMARYGSEIYLARPGVIIAEDASKARCKYVWIDKLLSPIEVAKLEKEEKEVEEKRQLEIIKQKEEEKYNQEIRQRINHISQPICGKEWLDAHAFDIKQSDIDALGMVVSSNGREIAIKNSRKLKNKEIRTVLASV